MENHTANQDRDSDSKSGFLAFLIKRVIVVALLIMIVLWALATGIDYLDKPAPWKDRLVEDHSTQAAIPAAALSETKNPMPDNRGQLLAERAPHGPQASGTALETTVETPVPSSPDRQVPGARLSQDKIQQSAPGDGHGAASPSREGAVSHSAKGEAPAPSTHSAAPDQGGTPRVEAPVPAAAPKPQPLPKGVAFIDAVVEPLEHELAERFWGWRPNDIINFTDNVNNYQLGVLEVTRRTVVQLTERISRTGSTDAFNRKLENAMNWLMIKADSYWFPTPEAKYKECLAELKSYRDALVVGGASFYTRADNLIPLLAAFEDLLGSCDENLVKTKEKDGSAVGFFTADNYFYYAKGVAATMASILEAVAHDFDQILISRHGEELLHHAIVSCRTAASLDPWLITNGALDGVLANHRAHMAAPISHARFYMGQLIKTLST